MPALWQLHREGADHEKRRAQAERKRAHRQRAKAALCVLAIHAKIPVNTGPVAGRRDQAADQAEQKRALVTNAAHLGELVVERRRQRQLEGAEHGGSHQQKHARDSGDDPAILQDGAEEAAVMPATTPMGTNMPQMPSTKASESSTPSERLLACLAPNTLTVTATMG